MSEKQFDDDARILVRIWHEGLAGNTEPPPSVVADAARAFTPQTGDPKDYEASFPKIPLRQQTRPPEPGRPTAPPVDLPRAPGYPAGVPFDPTVAATPSASDVPSASSVPRPSALAFLFGPGGALDRGPFFGGVFAALFIGAAGAFMGVVGSEEYMPALTLFGLVLVALGVWSFVALSIKRMRDRGHEAGLTVFAIVSVVGLLWLLVEAVRPTRPRS